MIDLDELRKVGTCVFLAAEKEVAEDIAKHIMDAADEIERLQAALKPESIAEVLLFVGLVPRGSRDCALEEATKMARLLAGAKE